MLTGWIVAAAERQGLGVQATSVPGVAQRTGATTYYIEIAPKDAQGRAPIFALFPVAGEVDVVLASELVEATRAVKLGYVTPERTELIASTHRVFLMQEKMAMGDGRLDPAALEKAARQQARRATFLDMERLSLETGAPISAVLMGALAGTRALPIDRGSYEAAIKASGIAVEKNLAAFATAHELAANAHGRPEPDATPVAPPTAPALEGGDLASFPIVARSVMAHGLKRLADYQDKRYAEFYLQRLAPFTAGDPILLREVARQLALRMSYEDVIRVAQLKAKPERFERIRGELGLAGNDPYEVQDFFKPGIAEAADILPPRLARGLLALGRRSKRIGGFHVGMKLKTSTVTGYLKVWMLAKMRRWRRGTSRYAKEQAEIESWLALVRTAVGRGEAALAREIVDLARLIKGYGDTHARGTANYTRIVETLVQPALDSHLAPADAAARVRSAREAALADPESHALDTALGGPSQVKTPA